MSSSALSIKRNKLRHDTDLHFCEWLAEHVGVGAVPGSCFFREDVNHLIRFHFAKRDDTLKAALNRLSELELKAKTYKQ